MMTVALLLPCLSTATHAGSIEKLPGFPNQGHRVESSESPCIATCVVNANGICVGCYRTLDEIATWSMCDESTRIRINSDAETRRMLEKSKQPEVDD